MEKQIDVSVQPASPHEVRRWVRWLICDNGMTLAEGMALFVPDTGHCVWEEERPPAEYEGQVRLAIARALEAS